MSPQKRSPEERERQEVNAAMQSAQNGFLIKLVSLLIGFLQFILIGIATWTLTQTIATGRDIVQLQTQVAQHTKMLETLFGFHDKNSKNDP